MRTMGSSEKGYNRQRAVAYIVFMMVGSYFHQSQPMGRFTNLYLHYAEMPCQKQYMYEERVIRAMERLDGEFRRKLSALRCQVVCSSCQGDLVLEFRTGGFEGLQCSVGKDGTFQITPVSAL